MEEARQHPALRVAAWTMIAARVGAFLCAVAILVAAVTRATMIPILAIVLCAVALVSVLANLFWSLSTGEVTWGRTTRQRVEHPVAYWLLIGIYSLTLIVYAWVLLFLASIRP